MRYKPFKALIALVLGSAFILSAASQEKLLFVSPGPGHPMYTISSRIILEACQKIGYQVEIRDLPPARATSMIDDASADGYLFADADFADKHPSSIMLKPPLGFDEIMVFTIKTRFKVAGWASLQPYSIGYMIGMVIVENNTKGFKTDPAQSPIQAFDKLKAGRTDIVVFPRSIGLAFRSQYPEMSYLEPPLERIPLYLFLSSKRADLAPRLAATLMEMEKSGRIRAITSEVEAGL